MWENLVNDASFDAQPDSVKEAARPFFDRMPEALGEILDMPVTLQSYADVRMKIARFYLDSGFVKAIVEALPKKALVFDRKTLVEMGEGAMEMALEMYEPLVSAVETFLEENGVTEEQVLLSPNVGLNGETRKLYKAQKLTIGKLLELQPYTLTDFNRK